MELIRSTDYFAAIPHVRGVGLFLSEPNQSVSGQAFRQRAAANISLVALVVITAVAVATVIFNWSR
jgi:hypothetical protein